MELLLDDDPVVDTELLLLDTELSLAVELLTDIRVLAPDPELEFPPPEEVVRPLVAAVDPSLDPDDVPASGDDELDVVPQPKTNTAANARDK